MFGEKWEFLLKGRGFLFGVMKSSKFNCDDGCIIVNILKVIEFYTLNRWMVQNATYTSVKLSPPNDPSSSHLYVCHSPKYLAKRQSLSNSGRGKGACVHFTLNGFLTKFVPVTFCIFRCLFLQRGQILF